MSTRFEINFPGAAMKRLLWLCAVLMICLLCSVAASAQTPLLRELAKEDVDAQQGKTVVRTDDERRKIVIEIIGKGELKGAEDKFDAGLILQHTGLDFCGKKLISYSADNYLLAHHLFISAYEVGYKKSEALYLIPASMDRYLTYTVGYQKYGTNREYNQETGKDEL